MNKEALTPEILSQFTGTARWYKTPVPGITYTDGVRHVAEEGEAYWLLDEIVICQAFEDIVRKEEFQVWKLVRDQEGDGATLSCEDGNGNVVLCKRIPFTDFPLQEIVFWFTNNVIFLPSEN